MCVLVLDCVDITNPHSRFGEKCGENFERVGSMVAARFKQEAYRKTAAKYNLDLRCGELGVGLCRHNKSLEKVHEHPDS